MSAIHLTIYRGATDPVPAAQDDFATWDEVADEIEALTRETARQKTDLLAIGPHRLREPYRVAENVEAVTLMVIDLDRCDLVSVIEGLDAFGVAALVYASPSDDADGDPCARRVRVVSPLSREITPAECKHARKAFAEAIGVLPGQGVEGAIEAVRLFFAGAIDGTPEREVFRVDGAPVDVEGLLDATLRHAWKPERPAVAATGAGPLEYGSGSIAAALGDAYAHAGHRWHLCGAVGGIMRRLGLSAERCEAEIRSWLPSGDASIDVGAGVRQALGAWRRPASEVSGFEALAALLGDDHADAVVDACSQVRRPRPKADPDAQAFGVPGSTDQPAATPGGLPLILRTRNNHVTLLWESDDAGHQPIAAAVIRNRIRELGLDTLIPLYGPKGGSFDIDDILEDHAATYLNTAYDFSRTVTAYDPTGFGSVVVGFPPCAPAPLYDADVDAWLQAFGGREAGRLSTWIASCAQANIDRLAACAIAIGPADVGKSLLGSGCAKLWASDPVPMRLVVDRFNGDLLRCPVLVDEEAQLFGSRELSTKKFRDIAQATARGVELKGKERVQLVGGQRYAVSCNHVSDIRFRDLGGPEVVAALRDRLLVVRVGDRADACRAALARLRLPGSWRVDLARVAGHFAWLASTIAMPDERFIGAGGDAEAAILAGHVASAAELFESLHTWLDGAAHDRGPWYARGGALYADRSALTLGLSQSHGWDLPRVSAALEPFRANDEDARLRLGGASASSGRRIRAWEIDAARLCEAGDVDAEALLARLGSGSETD